MSNLVSLVWELRASGDSAGGVSLLVYCIRGTRLRDIIRVNYDLFWGIICNGQVPIVLVINGLENEDDMDGWWRDNCDELEDDMGMKFQGHVCVTSTKGKLEKSGRYMFEEEYQQSMGKVRELVESACALHPEPLRIDGERWLTDIEWRLKHYLSEYNQRTGQERRALEDRDHGRKSRDPGIPDRRTTSGWSTEPLRYLLAWISTYIPTFVSPSVPKVLHDVPSEAPHPGNYREPERLVARVPTTSSNRHHSVPNHSKSATRSAYGQVQGNTQASVPYTSTASARREKKSKKPAEALKAIKPK